VSNREWLSALMKNHGVDGTL